jgi:N-acetylglucosaminyldiphosphoundecaprenol N-acetyl-beta-D-mannosaminyltransferase
MEKINFLGYPLCTDLKQINFNGAPMVINTLNPHSYCTAKKDKLFDDALMASDVLVPDGIGIVWGEKMIHKNTIYKIAGYDLFEHFMNTMNVSGGTAFFLGASNETLERITENAGIDFPNVEVYSYSPPFKDKFSQEDSKLMCSLANEKKPMVLFVGMTAPKQEKWVHENRHQLNAEIICSIGAVFDFYAGNVKRPSQFWISMGLEWLPRLLNEPKRLFYRNFVSTPKFILEIFCFKVFKKGLL